MRVLEVLIASVAISVGMALLMIYVTPFYTEPEWDFLRYVIFLFIGSFLVGLPTALSCLRSPRC
jgi:hypothetical protein